MKSNNNRPRVALSALAIAVACADSSSPAHAAEQLETIIVTASKTEQNVQQTALSIESLSDEKLAQSGVTSVSDVAKITPGLQLDQTGGGLTATVRIRGIGTPGFSALDPSVPIFIDGVAQSRTGAGFQDLLDVARVEVLRGPQGTLYGRNSTAGAINVVTKDANSRNWEGSVQGQVGNYNDREFKGTVNVPIVDNLLGGRFSYFSTKQDGYIDNKLTDKTGNGYADRWGGRSKIGLTPTSDVNVQWVTDYSKSVNHPISNIIAYPHRMNEYAAGGIVSNPDLSGAKLQANGLPQPDAFGDKVYEQNAWTLDINVASSVTVNWDITEGFLANNSFTSITAYQNYKAQQDLDKDSTVLLWANTAGNAKTESWSQEFRLSSDAGDKWEYVTGLYYYSDIVNSDQHNDNLFTDNVAAFNRGLYNDVTLLGDVPQLSNSFSHTFLKETNTALFGQTTYTFTDQFSVTAGLRGSWVKKYGNSDVDVDVLIAPNSPPISGINFQLIDAETQIERDLSGVLKARYFLDNDVMLYGSFDRGFKPGGFNRLLAAGTGAPTTYSKENSNNFEVGAKTQWLNNRLQANVALFHMDFTNYHNQTTDPVTSSVIVENVQSVTSDGVEFDIEALIGSNFTTGLSGTYLNPRVADDKVKHSQASLNNGHSTTLEDGQLINDVSQYSANLFGEFTFPFMQSPAEGFVRADLSYRSRFQLNTSPGLNGRGEPNPNGGFYPGRLYQSDYGLADLRFGVRNFEGHWQLTGWIKNLTDKEYAIAGGLGFGNQPDGTQITPGAPRTYGATVQYDY